MKVILNLTMLIISVEIFLKQIGINLKFRGISVQATADNPQLTYEMLYKRGVNSYLENDWGNCASYFELSLDDWHWWNENIVRCRRQCYKEANVSNHIFPISEEYEIDRVFEKIVMNTLCLVQCKKDIFVSRTDVNVSPDIISDFKMKKPYDYLQLCYFKIGQIDKAADAAATFLASKPDHEVMQKNINFYVKEGGLNIADITNLELGEYAKTYFEGDKIYLDGKYVETIEIMEKSLTLFWEALEDCRFACENPFDQGWFPDFVASIANHYTFTLRCKVTCPSQLSNMFGDDREDFVISLLNYLQFSYYKVGDMKKACEAVASILELSPTDPVQIENKGYYLEENGVTEESFKPRKSVKAYKERKELESKLLIFIDEKFSAIVEERSEVYGRPTEGAVSTNKIGQETKLERSLTEALLEVTQLLSGELSPNNAILTEARKDEL